MPRGLGPQHRLREDVGPIPGLAQGGSDAVLPWLWHRQAGAARIPPPAQELPLLRGSGKKRKSPPGGTTSFYYRKTVMKKIRNQALVRTWGKWTLHLAGRNVRGCSCFWKTIWWLLKRLKLPRDLAILMLGPDPGEMKSHVRGSLYRSAHSSITATGRTDNTRQQTSG